MRPTFLLCRSFLIRQAPRILQPDPRLVRCDSQEQRFDVCGKISTLRACDQEPELILKRQP
jgi:hypothetical protein